MQALVPVIDHGPWTVVSMAGTNDGSVEDVTIAVDRGTSASRFSIRTMRRTGTRLGPRNSIHGTVTDAIATAGLAAGCLLIEVPPARLPKHEAHAAMEEVEARANAFARDRDGWAVTALPLNGIEYALFTRSIPEGTVAHADLGWATIAMWSAGPLHEGAFRLADVESGADPEGRRSADGAVGPPCRPRDGDGVHGNGLG